MMAEIRDRICSIGQFRHVRICMRCFQCRSVVALNTYPVRGDALGRPVSHNADSFAYNARGEVIFSRRGAENAEEAYSYDGIENLLSSSANAATNAYSANSLNQYTSVLRVSAPPREIHPQHYADGNLLSQSGPLADAFRFRFSTKYLDTETGLYYYGYRFYSPALMRWLTRDPIEEKGGLNLYGFCGNDAVGRFDRLGQAHFEVRKLSGAPGIIPYSCFGAIIGWGSALALDLGLADKWNIEILHEHLFYDDGTNVGYSKEGLVTKESKAGYTRRDGREYDDCIMKEAQTRVSPPPYSLIGWGRPKYNCQDYADSLRRMYDAIKDDPEVKCKCKKEE